jgi:hypothetical protein
LAGRGRFPRGGGCSAYGGSLLLRRAIELWCSAGVYTRQPATTRDSRVGHEDVYHSRDTAPQPRDGAPHRGCTLWSAARPTGRTRRDAAPIADEAVAVLCGVPDGIRTLFGQRLGGSSRSCLNNAGTGLALGLPGPLILPPRQSCVVSWSPDLARHEGSVVHGAVSAPSPRHVLDIPTEEWGERVREPGARLSRATRRDPS